MFYCIFPLPFIASHMLQTDFHFKILVKKFTERTVTYTLCQSTLFNIQVEKFMDHKFRPSFGWAKKKKLKVQN